MLEHWRGMYETHARIAVPLSTRHIVLRLCGENLIAHSLRPESYRLYCRLPVSRFIASACLLPPRLRRWTRPYRSRTNGLASTRAILLVVRGIHLGRSANMHARNFRRCRSVTG